MAPAASYVLVLRRATPVEIATVATLSTGDLRWACVLMREPDPFPFDWVPQGTDELIAAAVATGREPRTDIGLAKNVSHKE